PTLRRYVVRLHYPDSGPQQIDPSLESHKPYESPWAIFENCERGKKPRHSSVCRSLRLSDCQNMSNTRSPISGGELPTASRSTSPRGRRGKGPGNSADTWILHEGRSTSSRRFSKS